MSASGFKAATGRSTQGHSSPSERTLILKPTVTRVKRQSRFYGLATALLISPRSRFSNRLHVCPRLYFRISVSPSFPARRSRSASIITCAMATHQSVPNCVVQTITGLKRTIAAVADSLLFRQLLL